MSNQQIVQSHNEQRNNHGHFKPNEDLVEAQRIIGRLQREVETAERFSKIWESDNERLREDLRAQREDNKVLRAKVKELEDRLGRLQSQGTCVLEKKPELELQPKRIRSPSVEIIDRSMEMSQEPPSRVPIDAPRHSDDAQGRTGEKRPLESYKELESTLASTKRQKLEASDRQVPPLAPVHSGSPISPSPLPAAPWTRAEYSRLTQIITPPLSTVPSPVPLKAEDPRSEVRLPASRSIFEPKGESSDEGESEVKVKDEAMSLSPGAVHTFLQGIPTLSISPKPESVYIPRKFLRLAYGGSDQQFLQFIAPGRNPSGHWKRRMVLPMINMNPVMPRAPGKPGLLFASRHEVLNDGPWTLFCRQLNSNVALWGYLGEYENTLVGKMTAQQFQDQTVAVKTRWAQILVTQKQTDCYLSMRARIALRKAGEIPSGDEDLDKALVEAEMGNVRANRGRSVDPEDIIEAFSRGDEGIDIIRMKCVSYDTVFANDIRDRFPNFAQMEKAALAKKKGKKKSAGKGKAKATPSHQGVVNTPSGKGTSRSGRTCRQGADDASISSLGSPQRSRSPYCTRMLPQSAEEKTSSVSPAKPMISSPAVCLEPSRPRRNRRVRDQQTGDWVQSTSNAMTAPGVVRLEGGIKRECMVIDIPSPSWSESSFYASELGANE